MSHLVAVSLGPVQGFVGSARRTRDFWMGSTILGECSKLVARTAAEHYGLESLILPSPPNIDALKEIDFDDDSHEVLSLFDVSNVVLFTAPLSAPLPELAADLKSAVAAKWRKWAERVGELHQQQLVTTWRDQLDDQVIECYVAWTPLGEDYAAARTALMRLLAGRKACRDFPAWHGAAGQKKSSLDGARETVLDPNASRGGLRIRTGEELDLTGLVKRADWGHNAIRFPSVSRLAADPWIRGAIEARSSDSDVASELESIVGQCNELSHAGVLRRRRREPAPGHESDTRKFSLFDDFPFEGAPLFVGRHDEIKKELEGDRSPGESSERVDASLILIAASVAAIGRRVPALAAPLPYFAVVVADGDAMGRVLSELGRAGGLEAQRAFSSKQSEFAGQARQAINRDLRGACVYAAADDVLALVPLDMCVRAAQRLRSLFHEFVAGTATRLGLPVSDTPTLSVGIAIGHFLDPLEDLFEFARASERLAKHPANPTQAVRNGLAVSVHPRSGAPFSIRDNWGTDGLDERLNAWTSAHQFGLIATKAAYDLREAARFYRGWPSESAEGSHRLCSAIRSDARRILRRKGTRANVVPAASADVVTLFARLHQLIGRVQNADELVALSHEIIVGQWIGDAVIQASPSPAVPGTADE